MFELCSLRGISSKASHCSVLTWISPNDHFSFKQTYCNLFSIIYCLHVDDRTVITKYSYSWANYIVINVQLQACKAKSYIVVDFVDKKLFFFAVSAPATTMLHLVTSTNGDMNDDLESWNQNILES